jgi:hypothetical protein
MLGLTVGCAQCHDHKSDPLTQRDYYRLLGYFASFAEDGNDGGALAAAPSLLAPRVDEVTERRQRQQVATAAAAAWAAVPWTPVPLQPIAADASFTRRDDGSLLATGAVPPKADYELAFTNSVAGVRTLRLLVLPDDSLPARGPGRADNGNFVLGEVELYAETDGPGERIAIASADADFAQPGFPAAHAIDGNPLTGWALDGHHEATALHLVLGAPLPAGTSRLVLRQQSRHHQHVLGRFAVQITPADITTPLAAYRRATTELQQYEATLPRCMVSGELPTPAATTNPANACSLAHRRSCHRCLRRPRRTGTRWRHGRSRPNNRSPRASP